MSPQVSKPPASSPPPDRRFAKDVAKHLDRRRMRRKVFGWMIVLGAAVLAAFYLTCGRGWGLGKGAGKGPGSGPGSGSVNALLSPHDAGPSRCHVRIAAAGIAVDGKPATVEEAVAACKGVEASEVLVTGGAREGDWEDIKAAFDRAGIQILRIERRGGRAGSSSEPSGGSDTGASSGKSGGS
jgi:hypothetical protein